ncbi:MAG: type I polyketide synthase, partial [Deltaproteobacteria bacterium]|nr:type I polyketide synthase [Deltaproteobacteria bacterium]
NLLAPDSEGQLRAMRNAYETSGLSPADIDLIECHGTGTPLGDTTELQSLVHLWSDEDWSAEQCAIGSVKSMIGHLLTGAGIAGLIKTVLAMNNKIFPPSIHFNNPSKNSPLFSSPFRVQTDPQPWEKRNTNIPRRAAINAFGFGGTNGHILLEEFYSESSEPKQPFSEISVISGETSYKILDKDIPPIAAIGMDTAFGPINSLRSFQETVFNGTSALRNIPESRFQGSESFAEKYINVSDFQGGFMEGISVRMDEFRIPPNEIRDILPQQLLMLKIAAGAMKNAEMSTNENRSRMSAFIGVDFDFDTTNFNLQWDIENKVSLWKNILDLDLDEEQISTWLEQLKAACGEPLTATRTLGALASIVASRVAREFHFGGPSFVVSEGEASGLRALEIGVRSLQQHETDAVLVGAIDFAGDVRNAVISNLTKPLSVNGNISPFDISGDGTLPGDGCAAVILKRQDDAIKDGNRIYCTIKGIGASTGGDIKSGVVSKEAYVLSLKRCFRDSSLSPESVTHMESHGSGYKNDDTAESEALIEFFPNPKNTVKRLPAEKSISLGAIKPIIGHTGAASGLASFVKSSLCLYHSIIPPLTNFSTPQNPRWQQSPFHMPVNPQHWLRDRENGPRRACVASLSSDGTCMHVILEESNNDHILQKKDKLTTALQIEQKSPMGLRQYGLFVVEGDTPESVSKNLTDLHGHVKNHLKSSGNIELAAASWYSKNPLDSDKKYAVSILLKDEHQLDAYVDTAKKAVSSGIPKKLNGPDTICYSPYPLFDPNTLAFVFPGSGSHYLGMGRGIGTQWPEIFNEMDDETPHLKAQMLPEYYMPWRSSWGPDWEKQAYEKIISDPLNMIFAQVMHGRVMSQVIRNFGVSPNAVIGYSLGESVGLFSMGAWPDPAQMLDRMLSTQLFRTDLYGPCNALRKAWKVPSTEQVQWVTGMVNRPAEVVQKAVDQFPYARLLIVNSPEECVIGGHKAHVNEVVKALECDIFYLDGVVTVHCDAAIPVANEYRDLHLFPTHPPENIRFYSCAWGKQYEPSTNLSAQSILDQAIEGFDFTKVIEQAYSDGIRIFMEMGPFNSCSRMIDNILGSRPHLAISTCNRGEDDALSILKFLGSLISERVSVDLNQLYGPGSFPHAVLNRAENKKNNKIFLTIGSEKPRPVLPASVQVKETQPLPSQLQDQQFTNSDLSKNDLIDTVKRNMEMTNDTHNTFLRIFDELSRSVEEAISLQTKLIEIAKKSGNIPLNNIKPYADPVIQKTEAKAAPPAFSKDMCMEFAIGSIARVLGPKFEIIDTYKTRVRLPDEPLMLVDRIVSIHGEKLSLGSGRIVTQHDVLSDAWYLDAGKAPICISVEAGQADLFLCSYLGIDHMVKGKRCYRLLDASVIFHRGLPQPGDTITYDINIDKFIKQGDTYLFFFNFKGTINDQPLISMSDGCAGFFTEEEVVNSGGIILTQEDTAPAKGIMPSDWTDLVPMEVETYDEGSLSELRKGNVFGCFGILFQGIELNAALRLPSGKMKLIDRVLHLDPKGGRYGMGVIKAEADVYPDDWFLTCHFMDDMVMPGTLMYECCAHTLRVFLLRLGWVTEKSDVCFEPIIGKKAVLKCRGPVTPDTKKVVYEVEIKELGYGPEPFVIADANMYADGHRIVMFKDMSMKISGLDRKEIESFWESRKTAHIKLSDQPDVSVPSSQPAFTYEQLLEFSTGDPAKAFGEKYSDFSKDRFIARLPNPPLLLIDRIPHIEPEPWVLKPGGWIQAEHDVLPDAWYFTSNRIPVMPFSILLEIALQPCGWLAAYMGSALRSSNDLKFRNLGGTAVS